jgi:hypothetical protein
VIRLALVGPVLFVVQDGAVVPTPVLMAGEPCPLCSRKAEHSGGCPVGAALAVSTSVNPEVIR